MGLCQHSNFRVFQEDDGTWPAAVHVGYGLASLFAALAGLKPTGAISILPDDHHGEPHARSHTPNVPPSTNWSLWFFSQGRWNWRSIGAENLDDIAVDMIDLLRQDDFEVREIRIVPPGAIEPRAL